MGADMSLDVTLTAVRPVAVYDSNITHNLADMARAAGIYHPCWAPEEIGVTKAGQLVPLLMEGLARLLADPKRFSAYNAKNGYGTYDDLVAWVRSYLAACASNYDADVTVSR
jgi:hypothetical protein